MAEFMGVKEEDYKGYVGEADDSVFSQWAEHVSIFMADEAKKLGIAGSLSYNGVYDFYQSVQKAMTREWNKAKSFRRRLRKELS